MLRDMFHLSIKSFTFVLFLFFSFVSYADEKPAIAIIIDDICGDNGARSKAILELRHHVDMTYSVLSNGNQSCLDSLKNFDWKGSSLMLHMPMEPLGDANPGVGAIMLDDKRSMVISKLSNAYKKLPEAIGVNNHMGSAVTADSKLMQIIVPWITRKKMFFIDSATSQTKACDLVSGQTRCYRSDLFLDHVQDEASVIKALNRATSMSQSLKRPVIAIGHPHKETLSAIKEFIKTDKAQLISIEDYLSRVDSPQSN